MIKILTYINTAFLAIAVGGGTLAYLNKDKIVDTILDEVKGQIPSLVKGSMPSLPTKTGLPSMPRF
tara:strand:+ start:279 stop:476 length:198 start_codon:yes stop_codon:yes gene_type:complete